MGWKKGREGEGKGGVEKERESMEERRGEGGRAGRGGER